eukprot:CAMPEP_0176383982 /NCGR_PEP_ID=MMETSP0126-20121128/33945_1 /TAXON_ID=141414 ORGANISM="Strombidinopsis acuminatum, Strain SPMC142" /NCGR_SAMPLE_ID=MMETSP0126 /ASSEMBLY_ACC=CAM_ASM_000229 /LENGTH=108 /DNA_ID=CAMNT_0017749389 /DNA_START=164 /DNA_END=490 /DNA_ORIENTATION=+
MEMPNSRGEANYVAKCKLCERTGSIEYVNNSWKTYSDENEQFKPIVTLECRGIEPIEFLPSNGFACKGKDTETEFDEVDLTDQDWAEFDEEGDCAVGIYEFKSKIERA